MAYLNNELSIKGVHTELTAVRYANLIGAVLISAYIGTDEELTLFVQPHKNGICAVDEYGKKYAFAKLKDFDYAHSNNSALQYMLEDLAEQLNEI